MSLIKYHQINPNHITEWQIYTLCNKNLKYLTIYFNLKLGDFLFTIFFSFIIIILTLYFCYYQDSYITGILSQICLFTVILLSLRTNILPPDKILYYHKFASIILIIIGLLHGLSSYNRNLDNKILTGFIFLILIIFNTLFSVSRFKDLYYHIFYYVHKILHLCIIIMSLIHGKYRILILFGIYLLEYIYRIKFRRKYISNYQFSIISPNIIQLTYPITKENIFPAKFLYLCVPQVSKYEFHPFSIANYSDKEIIIYIRVIGDWTNKLKSALIQNRLTNIVIDGYYGNLTKYILFYKYIILTGLGIGITPILSSLEYIYLNYCENSYYDINKIYLIVSLQTIEEFVLFIQPLYKKYYKMLNILEIYVHITQRNNDYIMNEYNISHNRLDINYYLNKFSNFIDNNKGAIIISGSNNILHKVYKYKDINKYDIYSEDFKY